MLYSGRTNSSFLLQYFESFYCAIDSIKNSITLEPQTGAENDADMAPESIEAVEKIQTFVLDLLKSQSIDAARFAGDFGQQEYQEAQFAMVALADEIFLQINWPGKIIWQERLLEEKVYQTHQAGETIFQKIEQFIKIRDPSRTEIALIYLYLLGLGFQGQYRGTTEASVIAHYKFELFNFAFKRAPAMKDSSSLLCEQAYNYTVDESKVIYFNEYKPALIWFAVSCLLMFFISYGVWRNETSQLYHGAQSIITMSTTAP